MKKIVVIFLLFLIVILSANCSNSDNKAETTKYDYTFTGENDFWKAEYRVTGERLLEVKNNASDNKEQSFEYMLTVSYKNDLSELADVQKLGISYESSVRSGSLNVSFPEDGIIERTYTIKSQSNGLSIVKDDIIKVTINIDGEFQEIKLKNESASS